MQKTLILIPALFVSQAMVAAPTSPKILAPGSSALRIEGATQIPGGTLTAGSYTIRIVDHLSDRVIVEVSGGNGGDKTLLGVPTRDLPSSSAQGPVLMKGLDSSSALRGFVFGRSAAIEFVYPKNDAVALAKANGVKVLAMDPASDGIVAKRNSGMSDDDMKIVTLWLLTPVAVGPGIEAARYHPEAAQHPDAAQPVETAQVRKPAVSRLPKTASEIPLLWLAAFGSLIAGLGLTLRRFGAASI